MKKENLDYISGIESILSHRPAKTLWLVPLIIGLLIIFIFSWLTFSEVDVIAPSQGKTIPSSRMILIQSKDINVIDKVFVKNGQHVNKGDLLIEFKDKVELFDKNSIDAKHKNLLSEQIFLEKFIEYIKSSTFSPIVKKQELSEKIINNTKLKLESNIVSFDTELKSLEMKIEKINFERKMIVTDLSKKIKLLPYTEYKLTQISMLVEKGLESEVTKNELEKEKGIGHRYFLSWLCNLFVQYVSDIPSYRLKKRKTIKTVLRLNKSFKNPRLQLGCYSP